jgi:hypothetical protein
MLTGIMMFQLTSSSDSYMDATSMGVTSEQCQVHCCTEYSENRGVSSFVAWTTHFVAEL